MHDDDPNRVANLPVDDRRTTDELLQRVPRVPWNLLQGSGYQVPGEAEVLLARVWGEHLASVGTAYGSARVEDAEAEPSG